MSGLTFDKFREANVARCSKWHPQGLGSWSSSDWLTAVTGELGELASLLKMRNRERDGLPGNKFSPTDKQVADELADIFTYLDLLAAALGVDLGRAAIDKFNEVSKRVGFPDRIEASELPEAEGEGPITREARELHAALFPLIYETLYRARVTGKYGPYSWRKETLPRQLLRAENHINREMQRQMGELEESDTEPHVSHAVTRLAIYAKRILEAK